MPEFKYVALLDDLPDECPPSQAEPTARLAFRFVFDPLDMRSFEVFATRRPAQFATDPCCSHCALSMFATEEHARAKFAKLMAIRKNIGKLIGDHLAEVTLAEEHGVQTAPNTDGHFDLHEYANVDLAPVTIMIGPL